MCRENSSFIEIGQKYRVLYMNTHVKSKKVNFALELATKAQRGSGGIALLFP
jgi:hypothetical protein